MQTNLAGINLKDLFPYLGQGVLCQNEKGRRQWVGLPLLQRPGYFSFMGTYVTYPYISYVGEDRLTIVSKAFDQLEACQYCRRDLQQALRGRIRKGFRLVEEQVSLEALIQRRDLIAHQLQNPPVRDIIVETFHELRFKSLTTEKVRKDAVWG